MLTQKLILEVEVLHPGDARLPSYSSQAAALGFSFQALFTTCLPKIPFLRFAANSQGPPQMVNVLPPQQAGPGLFFPPTSDLALPLFQFFAPGYSGYSLSI